MIRNLLVIFCFSFVFSLKSQTESNYSIKFQGIYGNYIPDSRFKILTSGHISGAELSVEFQTMGEKPWMQYSGFPITGYSAVWLNLGHPLLGDAFAIYPYVSFPIWKTPYFSLRVKAGAGISYVTQTYYTTNKDSLGNPIQIFSQTNGAIGSHLNVYFSGGGNLEIPLFKGISLSADYTWNHISNGSAVAPNSGLNMMNGFIGVKYRPLADEKPIRKELPDIDKNISFEIIASGGFRQLYYKDNTTFPTGSLIVGVYKPITNLYRMGLAVDAFYDGAFDGKQNKSFQRTYLYEDLLKNKLRGGISWQHELILGRLIAGFDFGIYLYNPLKNLEPYSEAKKGILNKPLIYPYDINLEDGWLYTRASVKYLLTKHLMLSLGLKTHLQKAEFIEWGVGYRF